ncbi:MAG TPA: hypothetical protein VK524_06335 [Polyangiaceae bacterium]|nr:hypothetical protein [Polyangiaceae bacterium]
MISRWTIVRTLPSAVRDGDGRKRRRAVARCFCGREFKIWLDDIGTRRRSHGCRSKLCLAHFEASQAVAKALDEWAHGKRGTHPFELIGDDYARREQIAEALLAHFEQLFRVRAQDALLSFEE